MKAARRKKGAGARRSGARWWREIEGLAGLVSLAGLESLAGMPGGEVLTGFRRRRWQRCAGRSEQARYVRALEKVARCYLAVAAACREFDVLQARSSGGPSAWARPQGEAALERAKEAATMAAMLREGLGE